MPDPGSGLVHTMTQPVLLQMAPSIMYSTPDPAFLQDAELVQLLSSLCVRCFACCQVRDGA